MSTKGKIAPRFAGGGHFSCTRVLALFLAFLLSFSLISEPLQVYASTLTSPEVSGGSEDSPYEVGADTKVFEATAIDQTVFTVEVQDDEILDNAVLVADLLDPESDEYADAMLSAWISYDIDPDKDLFEMVPYDVYFESAGGERLSYDGSAAVTMGFAEDPFPDTDADRFISYMQDSSESIRIDPVMEADVYQFEVPSLSVFGLAIMDKAELQPGDPGSIDALKELPKDEVGAAWEKEQVHLLGMVSGTNWYLDTYYVGEDDYYHVEVNKDFNLKYQIEFHADQDFAPGEVVIKVPKSLLTLRDGSSLEPSQIAVPEGTPDHYQTSPATQFNRYEDGEDNIVFFNYCKIDSGTNNAWQILYKNVSVMEIVDQSTWSIPATATVTVGGGAPEEKRAAPLTGFVDTTAKLTSVTKNSYSDVTVSYTPGLYTVDQVTRFADSLPEWCSGDLFYNYKYVVWKVTIKASGSQPYAITVEETPGQEGKIVGGLKSGTLVSECRDSSFNETYMVVVAYPADSINPEDQVDNSVKVTLHPIDGIDEDTELSASASWKYTNYHWIYHGDIIGVEKYDAGKFAGWLELYDVLNKKGEAEQDVSIPFSMKSTSRSFRWTHKIEGSTDLGQRIPGIVTRVTTVDDAVYAYPTTGSDPGQLLTGEDYYFDSVTIKQTDIGYDVWEDRPDKPEKLEASDTEYPGLQIYAMFATTDPTAADADGWEEVATVPWNDTGVLTYSFTPEQISRMPFRVKVVHDTINYSTTCDISVSVKIRQDSPVITGYLAENPNMTDLQLENVGGVTGQLYKDHDIYPRPDYYEAPEPGCGEDGSNGWYHDYTIDEENYTEPGIKDLSVDLYNVLPMRDSGFADITAVEKNAAAYKSHTASNDIANNRLNVTYNLTAHDGWSVGNYEIGSGLKDNGVLKSPGRNKVVFYDLLPFGMQFDPSHEIIAGRLTDVREKTRAEWINPKSWDTSNVEVKAELVESNYNNTGRSMVRFELTYTGDDDPAQFTQMFDDTTGGNRCLYYEGWGVSFQGYFDWADAIYSDKSPNICAFMPTEDDPNPLIGKEDEVFDDDGTHPVGGTYEEDYKYFKPNIDDSAITDEDCILYAYEAVLDDVVVASNSTITKLVKADSNPYGTFEKSAIVEPGGTYTYKITVQNPSMPFKGLVVFDRLENASIDRKGVPGDLEFETNVWHGTFQSVITDQLAKFGIAPVVYYNTDRNAKLPELDGSNSPKDVLTTNNGWTKADDYTDDLSKVCAIAVDMSKKANGDDFELGSMASVSFEIQMKAPDNVTDAKWAYNNPSFYREMIRTGSGNDEHFVVGNSVQVTLNAGKTLEVLKEFKNIEEVPTSVQNDTFRVFLTETIGADIHKFSDRVYELYTLKDGKWEKEESAQPRTTGADGEVVLKAGQKAVFENIPDAAVVSATEEESPFWKSEVQQTEGETYQLKVINEFRPVLYAQKLIDRLPETPEGKQYLAEDEFTFKLQINGEDAAGVEYWHVNSIRTDGGIPQKVSGKSTGTTSPDGTFKLKYGEIVAIIGSGVTGDEYTITEVDTTNNWICKNNTTTGELTPRGSSAFITNYYKWRSLTLTKTIQYQDLADAEDVIFTFKVEKKNEDGTYTALNGNRWVMVDASGNEIPGTDSKLSADGEFSCNLAGKYVKIDGLEAEATYRVTETGARKGITELLGKLYDPVIDSDEWTMPLHSFEINGEFVNNWRKRPLYVTKTVTYDSESSSATKAANEAVFEMVVKVDVDADNNGIPDGELVPLKDFEYEIYKNGQYVGPGTTDENGTFKIQNGQTIYFKDAGLLGAEYEITEKDPGNGFEQTFPTNKEPSKGHLGTDGTEASPVSFVNGSDNSIMLAKEYVFADPTAQEFYEANKDLAASKNPLAVNISIRAFTADSSYLWPSQNTEVAVFDQEGEMSLQIWEKGKSFTFLPGQTVVLQSGINEPGVLSFVVTESAADRQWLQVCDDYGCLIECTQTYPEKAASYEVGTVRSVTLVNTLSSHEPNGSAIIKDMAPGSNQVPDYATLTLILEKKSGEEWIPAEGIQYYIGKYTHGNTEVDWKNLDTDQTFTTGPDGLIQITKTENGYPFLQFLKDQVYVYGDTMTPSVDGTLRIRELLDQSDSAWGKFAWNSQLIQGQQFEAQWQKTEGPRGEPYDTIVNSNRTTKVRVGKDSSSESNQDFTFYLNQITGVDWSKAPTGLSAENHKDAITSLVPAEGIVYYIQDRDEEEHVTTVSGPHELGSDGKFTIKAGQYAEFDLPDKTMWTVYEEVAPGFYLDSMVAIEGEVYTTPLDDNTMLISSIAGVFGDRITAKALQESWVPESEIDKDQLEVTFYDSNGQSRKLNSSEFSIDPQTVPSKTGEFTITITDNNTGLTTSLTLRAEEPYTVKYAVRIYGIMQDYTDKPGMMAALTFGPATGADYRDNTDGHNLCNHKGKNGICISDLTWEEIAAQAEEDPYVFEECMKAGCTTSVPLNITGNLARDSFVMNGDGASALYCSIKEEYLQWNDGVTSMWIDQGSVEGGWAASRIRATLNGRDCLTDESVAGEDCLTTDESLFSCFPLSLQSAIVSKEVNTCIEQSGGYVKSITYDKLWAFSGTELYGMDVSADTNEFKYGVLSNEGPQYSSNIMRGATILSHDTYKTFCEVDDATLDEKYRTLYISWWLRTSHTYDTEWEYAFNVTGNDWSYYGQIYKAGQLRNYHCASTSGLAPGFCIGYYPEPYTVKYAVRIYGILTDNTDRPGVKVGLTFGPATGDNTADYTHSFDGQNKCHRDEDCISNMTWDKISLLASTDPTVFQECMEAGCVVSVPLNITGPLAGTSYKNQMDNGDGASIIYDSISSDYRNWNQKDDETGDWRTSRIRATLNGFQEKDTNEAVAGTKDTNLTADTCLFAAFPEDLQAAIVPKVVKSDSKRDSFDPSDVDTTYDNLWLFSADEIFAYDPGGSWRNDYLRYENGKTNEGPQYPANQYMGITAIDYINNIGFTESGSSYNWWLRSLYRGDSGYACCVSYNGGPIYNNVYSTYDGLAPGFCVGYYDPYTVKYAVRIYGILVDDIKETGMKAGLTFGPATGTDPGADYTHSISGRNRCNHEGPNGICISDLTWSQIIDYANTDPTVFEKCMEAGCVVSVPLYLSNEISAVSGRKLSMDEGNGVSILYDSIKDNYRKWNDTNSNAGGWPASRIRATLNGFQTQTDENVAGEESSNLTADTCLFAAFPQELQDAIVAKEVKSDTIYDKYDPKNQEITYDKLWLFSGGELYELDKTDWSALRDSNGEISEGPQYLGNKFLGITTEQYKSNIGFKESSSSYYGRDWWLRSIGKQNEYRGNYIEEDGRPNDGSVTSQECGLAPGFCIGSIPNYDVKYAVRIYGILVDDTNQAGMKAGLTFGPATGTDPEANYTHSFTGRNKCNHEGPDGICISDLSWSQIIDYANSDPTVFEKCMEAGCVVSVPLNLSDEIISDPDYEVDMDSGDGASILYESINYDYRTWNQEWDETGGWRTSRIRATLNGFQDGETNLDVAGAKETNLTEDNCLFAAFPEELKTAIVPKVVKSDSKRDSFDPSDVDTTYDNLWLFSADEIFAYDPGGSYNNNYLRYENGKTNEGPQYPANQYMGITAANYRNNVGFTESGSTYDWWLRSLYRGYSSYACYVDDTGSPYDNYVSSGSYGLAPGFCIGTPYTVKYAVRIYGINADQCKDNEGNIQTAHLTFGPATGTNWVNTKEHTCPMGDDCISNMTWTQIIAKARTSPESFQTCMENGCPVSVPLNIKGPLAENDAQSYQGQMDNGFGASVLYDSINSNYSNWNDINDITGGYPASRIRAVLNGYKVGVTDKSVAGEDIVSITEDQSLFAAFPQELQDAIVAKAVKSDTVYSDITDNNIVTYDMLWLFSGAEIFDIGESDNRIIRKNEGAQYPGNVGLTTSNAEKSVGYSEDGSRENWVLRSLFQFDRNSACTVSSDVSIFDSWYYTGVAWKYFGIAPGFCIR